MSKRLFSMLYSIIFSTIFSIIMLSYANADAGAIDANERVKAADAYRLSADEIMVNTVVKRYKNNKLDRERSYDVYVKPDRQSLVISKTPSEMGQKVLMLHEKFWLLLPKTKRPIRITPLQKLLGEASVGDVATMKWHEDYTAEYLSALPDSNSGYHELRLTAKRNGATYQTILLSLAPATNIPMRAELYLASGKLAKIAHFETSRKNGREQVSKMILKDTITVNQYTEIEYTSNKPYSLHPKYFNPAYLARNPSLSIQ